MLIFRRTVVLTKHLVSSLFLGDCSVHSLREDCSNLCTEQSPKESDDTRCCVSTTILINLLYSSTCFEHFFAYHQEVKLYYSVFVMVTLCRWPSGAPPTDFNYTRYCIIQFYLLMMSTIVLETCRGI